MAEGVLRKMLAAEGAEDRYEIDSAGTHDYHAGEPPFPLAVAAAQKRGYEIHHLVARRIRPNDLDHFDLILAMDNGNLANLRTIAPTRCKPKIELLLAYGDKFHDKEIRDPYGAKPKEFEIALDMIEDGCRGLAGLLARTAARR